MNPDQNQYDFILNSGQPPKKSFLPGPGASMSQRIVVVAIGLAVLLMVVLGVVALLSSGGSRKDTLLGLAQQQTEIIRVSEAGLKDARAGDTRAFAATIKVAVTSNQNDTLALLGSHGVKSNDKRLLLGANPQTDSTLEAALQQNRYDEALNKILTDSVTAYLSELSRAYESASNAKEKELLAKNFTRIRTVLDPATE